MFYHFFFRYYQLQSSLRLWVKHFLKTGESVFLQRELLQRELLQRELLQRELLLLISCYVEMMLFWIENQYLNGLKILSKIASFLRNYTGIHGIGSHILTCVRACVRARETDRQTESMFQDIIIIILLAASFSHSLKLMAFRRNGSCP